MKDILFKIRAGARAAAEAIRKQLNKGNLKCDVCGRRVKLEVGKAYIIKEPEAPLNFLTVAPKFVRVIDCPRCGNQIKYAKYIPPFEPEEGCEDED